MTAEVQPTHRGAQINWRILEPGDGTIIQLVLAGDQTSWIVASGTVEGGGRPRYVHLVSAKEEGAKQLWSSEQKLSHVSSEVLPLSVDFGEEGTVETQVLELHARLTKGHTTALARNVRSKKRRGECDQKDVLILSSRDSTLAPRPTRRCRRLCRR